MKLGFILFDVHYLLGKSKLCKFTPESNVPLFTALPRNLLENNDALLKPHKRRYTPILLQSYILYVPHVIGFHCQSVKKVIQSQMAPLGLFQSATGCWLVSFAIHFALE